MTVVLRVPATSSEPALILRPWTEDDIEAVIAANGDPAIRRWTTAVIDSRDDAARWVAAQQHGWETGERLSFAVGEESAGPPLGHVVLAKIALAAGQAEVGYWMAAPARGRGVATRAVSALAEWAFDRLAAEGLEHLHLLHQVDNVASCRVAVKAGFRFDRVLPAVPPFPMDGHLHRRSADFPTGQRRTQRLP